MVEPVRDSAAVVLKNADRAVIVPSRGTENAKFVNVPAAFVRSIVVPSTLTLGALLPKPISDGIPARPPAMVVIVNGVPDEKGIIAEEPATPVGPVAPVIPAVPVAPVAPVGPVGPVGAYILGKQTTCKNAVPLNRVLMGVDLDVFSYSAVLISEFQANAYIAIVIHLDLLHEFN